MIEATKDNLRPIGYKIYVELDKKVSDVGGIIIPDQFHLCIPKNVLSKMPGKCFLIVLLISLCLYLVSQIVRINC